MFSSGRPSVSQSSTRGKRLIRSVLLIGSVLLGSVRSSPAATITVTRIDDAVATGDGVTLREAIQAANTDTSVDGSTAGSGADTIVFAPNLFATPQILTLGGTNLTLSSNVTITGPGADKLTISGNNASRIFDCPNATTMSISGLRLTGGNVAAVGGAIRALGTNLSVSSSVISGNTGTNGGGIYSLNGSLSVASSTITTNTASNRRGGGLWVQNSTLAVSNSTISGNTAVSGGGGGIFARSNISTIDRCTLNNNSGNYGGGIYFRDAVAGTVARNSTLAANIALFNSNGNVNAGGGGGMLLYNGSVAMQNCTVAGNTAPSTQGGGIHIKNNSYGGGTVAAAFSLASTIVSGNSDRVGNSDITRFANANVVINAANNLFQTAPVAATINGTNSANISGQDPLLGPLQNNVGPTLTRIPQAGSPAINAGSNPGALSTDQRGVPRTAGVATDIGAVETFVNPSPLVVSTLADENDGNISTGNLSLREAVLLSNIDAGADTVAFAAGLTGTILLSGSGLDVTSNVTITGPGATVLTVSGGNLVRPFNIDDSTATQKNVAISGLRISNGRATNGGGIQNAENLTLTGVEVVNCVATSNGGGIVNNSGTLSLVNSTLTGNQASGKGGGASSTNGTVSIQQSMITGNNSTGRGGGLFLYRTTDALANDPVNVTIANSTLSNNISGNRGGGAHLYKTVSSFANVNISGNVSTNRGGGLHLYKGRSTIDGCTISGNTSNSGVGGGGGLNLYKGTHAIKNTTVSGNTAALGGGGVTLYKTTSTLIQNCTISGNSASSQGGNVLIKDASTVASLENSTIASAINSSGIQILSGNATIKSTLVAGNTPADITGAVNAASDHNLIGGADVIGISNADANGNQVGSVATPIDAKLGPLADNGGPTLTRALLAGSPALGAGSNASTLAFDQRGTGFPRMRAAVTDVGAIEAQAPQIGSASVSDITATSGQKLTFTVTATDADDATLAIKWTFSDGTTLDGLSVIKSFVAPGTYTAFVTVTDSVGLVATSELLTITVTAPAFGTGIDSDGDNLSDDFETIAGTPIDVATTPVNYDFKSLQVSLSFSAKSPTNDSMSLKGTLPTATTDFNAKKVAVSIGGALGIFTLDKAGKSAKGQNPSFSIKKPKKGFAAFTTTFKKTSVKTELSDEGLTNNVTPKAGKPVTIPVVVGFENTIRIENMQLVYKLTKISGTGKAK